jgi:hypothetical protein
MDPASRDAQLRQAGVQPWIGLLRYAAACSIPLISRAGSSSAGQDHAIDSNRCSW